MPGGSTPHKYLLRRAGGAVEGRPAMAAVAVGAADDVLRIWRRRALCVAACRVQRPYRQHDAQQRCGQERSHQHQRGATAGNDSVIALVAHCTLAMGAGCARALAKHFRWVQVLQ